MALEAYEHYWSSARGLGDEQRRRRMAKIRDKAGVRSGFGSGDAPIGAQSPMVQDRMLQELARRAAGRIDDWESLVDPTVSYGENLAKIQQKGGKTIESTKRRNRQQWLQSNDDRQRRRAKRAIRDNLADIEAGDAERLVADIREEYDAEFVETAVAEARALETPTPDAPTPTPTPETSAEPAEPPEPQPTPETPTPTVSPKYRGTFGAVRLFIAYVLASLLSGVRSGLSTARTARLILELEARQAIREYRPLAEALAVYARYYRLRLTHDRPTN